MKNDGHQIFISEFSMPDSFECVLEIKHTQNLNFEKRKNVIVEKLFIPKGQ